MNFEITPEKLVHIFQSYELRTRAEQIEYLQRTFEDELCLQQGLHCCKHAGIINDNIYSRKKIYGENLQQQTPGPTFWKLYLEAYRDYPIKLILIVAIILIAVSVAVNLRKGVDWAEGLSIIIAVQLSILVSVLNNLYKVHIFKKLTKSYEQLRKVTVVRGGSEMLIHPSQLVVGDMCLIDTYEVIPCDGILLEEIQNNHRQIKVNESSRFSSQVQLTEYSGLVIDETILGRREAARKAPLSSAVKQSKIAAVNCNKMTIPSPVLIAGTTIIKGSGRMLVLAVGENSSKARNNHQEQTYVAQSRLIPATPLQTDLLSISSKLSLYGRVVAITLMLVMIGRFLLEKLDSQDWQLQQDLSRAFEIILLGCCILVLSVPEGLPLSVTISIAYSLESMVKDGCLIRNIEVCETIGLVTDLCIDKDGLLVEDKLKANTLFSFEMEGMLEVADGLGAGLPNGSVEFKQKLGLCLMNKVCLDQSRWTRIEQAFRQLAHYYKIHPYPILSRHSIEQSRSAISIKYILLNNKKINVLKGQPLKLIEFCKFVYDEGSIRPMTEAYKEDIMKATKRIELKGESVMLLGYNEGKGVVFLALVGLQEQIKPNINSTLQRLQSTGIRTCILMKQSKELSDAFISHIGLSQQTAKDFLDAKVFFKTIGGLICKACRVSFCDCPYDMVLAKNMNVQPKIDTVANKQAFSQLISNLSGLYNCGPQQKYALIVGMRDVGRIVATTSNTYEDKLTLRNVDVGFVSCGSSYKHDLGQVGGINMLESNINVIIRSILWGRNVVNSVQKFLVMHLTANIVAIVLTIYGGIVWQQGILKPVQLLWINLLIDNLAAMALATEPRRQNLSNKATQYNLISRKMIIKIVVLVLYQLLVLIGAHTFGEWFIPEFRDSYDGYLTNLKRDPFFNKYNSAKRPYLYVRAGRRYTITGQPDYLPVYEDLGVESRHFTFIFNLFVILQIFNFISCRKVHRGNTFIESFRKNRTFLIVLVTVLVAQYLLVTFGSVPVQVYGFMGLHPYHWLICISLGLIQLGITGLMSLKGEQPSQSQKSTEIVNYRLKSSKIKPRNTMTRHGTFFAI